MCSKIELPPGYCWTKAGLQPSYSQATARLPPHYRSKTYLFTNKYIFQQKYVHFGIRNILEVIEMLFQKAEKNFINFLELLVGSEPMDLPI